MSGWSHCLLSRHRRVGSSSGQFCSLIHLTRETWGDQGLGQGHTCTHTQIKKGDLTKRMNLGGTYYAVVNAQCISFHCWNCALHTKAIRGNRLQGVCWESASSNMFFSRSWDLNDWGEPTKNLIFQFHLTKEANHVWSSSCVW